MKNIVRILEELKKADIFIQNIRKIVLKYYISFKPVHSIINACF